METKDKVIIGIDPGTNVMGYGILRVVNNKPQLEAMGVLELKAFENHYLKLRRIFERTLGLIDQYHPDEMAIEAPFFGKNVQSMLKLGRAQGVAMAAALYRDITITEYAPLKIKMAVTGMGGASKDQVKEMLRRILKIDDALLNMQLDATDGLAAAYCHFLQSNKPLIDGGAPKSWKEYIAKNPSKVQSTPAAKSKSAAKKEI